MSQYVDTNTKTFTAGAAIGQFLRVILTSGKLALAGALDRDLGTMEIPSFADLDPATVRLRTASGTVKMIANGAISQSAAVYGAASGKIGSTGSVFVGTALEAATADNDIIEVLRGGSEGATSSVASIAATGSAQGDAAALTSGFNTVSAADGTKGVILPAAQAGAGPIYVYNEHASNGLKIYPASGDDINDGTTNAAIVIEGKTVAVFNALDATTWAAQYTVNT